MPHARAQHQSGDKRESRQDNRIKDRRMQDRMSGSGVHETRWAGGQRTEARGGRNEKQGETRAQDIWRKHFSLDEATRSACKMGWARLQMPTHR